VITRYFADHGCSVSRGNEMLGGEVSGRGVVIGFDGMVSLAGYAGSPSVLHVLCRGS